MIGTLFWIRILGGMLAFMIIFWSFGQFRYHQIRRGEFSLLAVLGTGLLSVSIHPNTINVVAGILSLDRVQFGRVIAILLLSNFVLWIMILAQRARLQHRDIQFDLLVRRLAQAKFEQTDGYDKIHEITVIMPALDEAENLKHVLPQIPQTVHGMPLGVLVVDDGSHDNTVSVVNSMGYSVVSNPINRGGGAALRLGYDIARQGGACIVVTMDADGQHLPGEIERLVIPIIEGQSDIVIGSRVIGYREKDSIVRWIGIHVYNKFINLLAGTRITDCTNGFRAFRVSALQQVLLMHDQFHTAELIIEAARKKLRITEAPVSVMRRHTGFSKKGHNLSYGFNFFKSVFKAWYR